MSEREKSVQQWAEETDVLRRQLEEATQTLSAIRQGSVDGFIMPGAQGDQLFTLKGSDEPYRVLIEEMNEGALTLSEAGWIVYCNRRFAELVRAPLDRVIGHAFNSFVRPDNVLTFDALLEAGMAGRSRGEIVLQALDGVHVPIQAAFSRLPVESAGVLCLLATDLTDRVQAAVEREKLLAEVQASLQQVTRSNTDSQQFAAVASHDLQEPLRAVAGCVQLLRRKYSEKLDGNGGELIQMIVDGSTRMKALIDDLLAYSRTGGDEHLETIDTGEAMQLALANLDSAIRESKAEIVCKNLPSLRFIKRQFAQVLQNLIGNAIKYRGLSPPRIQVGAEHGNEGWTFSVADNGIGFEPQFAEKIFDVFQRLHTREEYQGTGIGLAIVKKIVERRGGKIWAKSVPGEGSTFTFSVPDKEPIQGTPKTEPDPPQAP